MGKSKKNYQDPNRKCGCGHIVEHLQVVDDSGSQWWTCVDCGWAEEVATKEPDDAPH